MKRDEYIETLVVGKQMIPIGIDDAGQCYFYEYINENGELAEMSLGSYNMNYREDVEYIFGDPMRDCELYPKDMFAPLKNCDNRGKYGYCAKCKYGDVERYSFNSLVDLGIIDRRGNLQGVWKELLVKREEEE